MRTMLMARSIAVLLACLSHTGQSRRSQVGEGRARTNSQERLQFSEKAIDAVSQNLTLAGSKQSQSNSGEGTPKALAALLLAGALNSTAGFQMAGRSYNLNTRSGTNVGVPRSLGVASTSFMTPLMALSNAGMPRHAKRHAGPLMALATPMDEGGDDEFKAALSRLAPPDELPKLRERISELDRLILKAIKEDDFEAAARCRDQINELRLRDPVPLSSSVRSRMQAAVKADNFEEAAKCRDQLRTLKQFQPEYQLAGTWKGKFPEQGDVFIKIRYDGDTLIAQRLSGGGSLGDIAERLDGDICFTADVSEPNDGQSMRVRTLKDFAINYEQVSDGATHFEGKGRVAAGGFVPGQLYLMADEEGELVQDTIGFLFLGKEDGGRGGGGVLAMAGGVVDDRRGGAPRGDGDGGGGDGVAFVAFKRMDDYDPPPDGSLTYLERLDIVNAAAALDKLFKLDSEAGE